SLLPCGAATMPTARAAAKKLISHICEMIFIRGPSFHCNGSRFGRRLSSQSLQIIDLGLDRLPFYLHATERFHHSSGSKLRQREFADDDGGLVFLVQTL